MSLKATSRKNAVHVMLAYTGGCNGCEIEVVNAVYSPRYDLEQYRVLLTWNPREADVLLVTGTVNRLTLEPLKKIYEAIPEPKAVVAVGACAIMGGVFATMGGELGPSEEAMAPLEKHLPVAAKVPGCAPRPEDIIVTAVKALPLLMGAP